MWTDELEEEEEPPSLIGMIKKGVKTYISVTAALKQLAGKERPKKINMSQEQKAKIDKHIIDLFQATQNGFGWDDDFAIPTTINGIKSYRPIGEIMSELSYSCYAHNRLEGMTHDRLVRIGLGTDAMKDRFEREQDTEIRSLSSVGCIIDKELMVYAQYKDGTYDKENGVHIGDVNAEWWEALSTHDRDLIHALMAEKK